MRKVFHKQLLEWRSRGDNVGSGPSGYGAVETTRCTRRLDASPWWVLYFVVSLSFLQLIRTFGLIAFMQRFLLSCYRVTIRVYICILSTCNIFILFLPTFVPSSTCRFNNNKGSEIEVRCARWIEYLVRTSWHYYYSNPSRSLSFTAILVTSTSSCTVTSWLLL